MSNGIRIIPTQEEASRAIYLDFEGFEDASPSLAGVQVEGQFSQTVFSSELDLAAKEKQLVMAGFAEWASDLFHRSSREGRLIAAYSQHEYNVLREYAGIDVGDRYIDVRMIAKQWKNRIHRQTPISGWGLKDFLVFIGYERGSYLGDQKTTKRLRSVASMLRAKGRYSDLTATVKAQWTKVLQHNRIDVTGMRALLFEAAQTLGAWPLDVEERIARRMTIIKGDITTLDVDAIVNAANCSLLGGGGVDGAIHRAAGPELPLACLALKGCDVGDAKITPGFRLPAKYVIHTVGPTYNEKQNRHPKGYISRQEVLLCDCYRRCLKLAAEHGIRTLAFPSLSTGAFGYPIEPASMIALRTLMSHAVGEGAPERLIMVAYSDDDYRVMQDVARMLLVMYRQTGYSPAFLDPLFSFDRNDYHPSNGPIVRFAKGLAEAQLDAEGAMQESVNHELVGGRQKDILARCYGIEWDDPITLNRGIASE